MSLFTATLILLFGFGPLAIALIASIVQSLRAAKPITVSVYVGNQDDPAALIRKVTARPTR